MKIHTRILLWLFTVLPFFKPDCISYLGLGKAWNIWLYATIVFDILFLAKRKFDKCINAVGICIFSHYFLQIAATYINGYAIQIDIINFLKIFALVSIISFLTQKHGFLYIKFIYNLLTTYTVANLITILLFYNKGILRDAYNTPIYFWSTRNHLISLLLASFILGGVLVAYGFERRKKYNIYIILMTIQLLLLKSSTAIIATIFFLAFIYIGRIADRKECIFNIRNVLICGIALQFSVIVFRIQERFDFLIKFLFNKDATLSKRTGLWDQSLALIGTNLLWGNGNSAALNQGGWLTMSVWNNMSGEMDDVYYVAHNQLLEVMLNGGIIALIPYLMSFVCLSRKIIIINNNRAKFILTGGFFALFVVMITEILYPYEPVYTVMIITSLICNLENNHTFYKKDSNTTYKTEEDK